jgi:hypothetical protein
MLQITREDDELFGTVLAAIRMGRIQDVLENLSARYEREWDDPLAGFPYALAMVAMLDYGSDSAWRRNSYNEVTETLGDLLYHFPDHWLGRFLRLRTRALVPLEGEYPEFAAAERARAAADAEELIERQSMAAWRPWFACTYLQAARLAWDSDQRDPDRTAELVSAATAHPGEPIPFRSMARVLCSGFFWYCGQPDVPERAAVENLMRALFPHTRPGRYDPERSTTVT